MQFKPGHVKIPDEDYFSIDAFSNSLGSAILEKTPLHAVTPQDEKPKTHFDFGHAIHYAVLEPTLFHEMIVKGPPDRRGNRWKDALAAAGKRIVLVEKDYLYVEEIMKAIDQSPFIAKALRGNDMMSEQTVMWTDEQYEIPCKAKLDGLRPQSAVAIDLKTTTDASLKAFQKSVANFGYHRQAAHYLDAANQFGQYDRFIFIVLEKEPPFAHACFELDAQALIQGAQEIDKAKDIYAECRHTGIWPGFPEGVQSLSLPRWAQNIEVT